MRVTKFIFIVSLVLLFALFVNGLNLLLQSGENGNGTAPIHEMDWLQEPGEPYRWQTDSNSDGSNANYSSSNDSTPVNLLVMGLDKDGTRCDVIMLFNFKPGASRLNILSVARDTKVRMDGHYSKINALYAKGGERKVAQKITEITGLPVHYYVTLDFKGFRKCIDTLGGVEYYVPFRMNYDDPTQGLHIHLKKGLQLLDGNKAEQLVRYRKGNRKGQGYSEGDLGRIELQQDFMKALIKQKVNLRYIAKTDEMFTILREYVKTNATLTDIVKYLGSIGKIDSDEIESFMLPGDSRMIGDVWYFIYDRDKTESLIQDHFYY